MRLKSWKVVLGILLVALLIQLVPLDRSNPPVTAEIKAPANVMSVLQRACYDCHSNETVWPWYSRIAPLSWLVAYDTWEGREHLNFSSWESLATEQQRKLLKETREVVDEGEMPPWIYQLNHSEAKLTEADLALIRTWASQP